MPYGSVVVGQCTSYALVLVPVPFELKPDKESLQSSVKSFWISRKAIFMAFGAYDKFDNA